MLDQQSALFIQTGVSISLAACGPDRLPEICRGLGCKVLENGRRVAVFLPCTQSQRLLEAIRLTGQVANVFSLPSDNRTLQVKGDNARVVPFDPADLPIIASHVEAFLQQVLPLGMSEAMVRAMLDHAPDDLVTVLYSPRAVFAQTPGPGAGELAGSPA